MGAPIIRINNVSRNYGKVQALSGVELTIERGEIFGLIGHNGAGKSTLFRIMLGLLAPSSGNVEIGGVATQASAFREVRRRIGYLPESVVLYDNLTGLETLHFFARLKGVALDECGAALETVGLSHAAERRVKGYSKGMRQRLAFAQALLGTPELLFLDEPTSGLDPEGIRDFYRIVDGLRQQGCTVVLTSHILAEIEERVDRLAMIRNGQIDAVGSVAQLRARFDMPLHIEIEAQAAILAQVHPLLQGQQLLRCDEYSGRLVVQCRQSEKLLLLAALAPLMAHFDGLAIREPSLEELFMGYRTTPPPSALPLGGVA